MINNLWSNVCICFCYKIVFCYHLLSLSLSPHLTLPFLSPVLARTTFI